MNRTEEITHPAFHLPPMGMGGWALGGGYDWGPVDKPAATKAVRAAIEAGINLIDTAPIYGEGESERFLGGVLKGYRSQVIIASKCGLIKNGSWTDHDLRPSSIRTQLENSLKNLQTDYLDLYQIHYPDPKVSLEEAWSEMERLRQAGKVRAIGLCNVTSEQIRLAAQVAPVFSVQNEFSLLHPLKGKEVFGVCRELNIAFMGYGTLCGGILSGKYKKEPNLRRADARNYFYQCYRGEAFERAQKVALRVKYVAEKLQVAPAAVAVAWAREQVGVSCVLCGARNEEQMRQNAQALTLQLTQEELDFLEGTDDCK